MKLGAFSMSLAVKDLATSRDFYQAIGFDVFAGDMRQNYLIMKNGNAIVGLFQGMFPNNILTFNPGWDENAQLVEGFDDIRTLQQHFRQQGIPFVQEAPEDGSGPASFIVTDPDGNIILFDQHV